MLTVDVKHRDDTIAIVYRHDYLAARQRAAGYMPWELLYIGDNERLTTLPRRATYATTIGYACASYRPLKRP
jgi:hypothetical protein